MKEFYTPPSTENAPKTEDGKEKSPAEVVVESVRWQKIDKPDFKQEFFYRIMNTEGLRQFMDTGSLGSFKMDDEKINQGGVNVTYRGVPFPSFAKGEPDLTYLKSEENNFIFESDYPMYRRGETHPATGKEVRGRHWAYRPLNENGNTIETLPGSSIKRIFMVDKEGDFYLKKESDVVASAEGNEAALSLKEVEAAMKEKDEARIAEILRDLQGDARE